MGVGVDKAGQEQLAGDVDDPGLSLGGDGAGDLNDLLAVHQYVGLFGALTGDHRAAPEQRFHMNRPHLENISIQLYCITKNEKIHRELPRCLI